MTVSWFHYNSQSSLESRKFSGRIELAPMRKCARPSQTRRVRYAEEISLSNATSQRNRAVRGDHNQRLPANSQFIQINITVKRRASEQFWRRSALCQVPDRQVANGIVFVSNSRLFPGLPTQCLK